MSGCQAPTVLGSEARSTMRVAPLAVWLIGGGAYWCAWGLYEQALTFGVIRPIGNTRHPVVGIGGAGLRGSPDQ